MIRLGMLGAIVAASTLSGCAPDDGPTLVVATGWPPALRADLEADFRRGGGSIAWVEIGPGDSPSAVLEGRGRDRPDLILGVPEASLARLADAGRLAPIGAAEPAPWRPVRRLDSGQADARIASAASYADPRDDPATLAEARSVLATAGWAEGYRVLARRAALSRPEVGRAPRAASTLAGGASPGSKPAEAVALVLDGPRGEEARRFLDVLEARNLVDPPNSGALEAARADGLLADLLGAALVDAHAELRAAEAAVRRPARPGAAEAAEAAFGDRPPWPPASVGKLQAGSSDGSLVEALAEQVAPDADAKAWLLASWSAPKRPVDGSVLAELAGAVDGRLAREPRFRAWLRAEWAAWHRQLYRRVARVAGGYVPS